MEWASDAYDAEFARTFNSVLALELRRREAR